MADYCDVELHIDGKVSKTKLKKFKEEVCSVFDSDVTEQGTVILFEVKWSAESWLSQFDINEFFKLDWELVSTSSAGHFTEHIYNVDDTYDYTSREYTEIYVEDICELTYDEIMEEYGIDPEVIKVDDYLELGKYEFEYL